MATKSSGYRYIRNCKDSDVCWLLLVCIVASLAMLAFPLLGVPDGYDVAQHLMFAATYREAIDSGTLLPLWAHTDNYGLGNVGIRFYPPFADYLLATTQVFSDDWYRTLIINSFLWMFPGCVGVYFWLKEFRSPQWAALGSMLYALMPYHLQQIYRFQLYSEFVAAALLPFCFLFATKLIRQGKFSSILGLALSCALLILTHIPSTVIGFAGLGVYVVLMIDWKRSQRGTIGKFALAATMALAATSFYLVRLVAEMDWVRHSTAEFSTGFYDHRRHLFPILQNFGDMYFIGFMWLLDVSILFTLFTLLPLTACIFLLRTSTIAENLERKFHVAITGTGFFSILMLSTFSGFIWDVTPLLQKIQFPWRFLTLATLMGSVSIALAVPILLTRINRFPRFVIYPTVLLFFGLILFDLTQTIMQAGSLTRDKFTELVVNKPVDDTCTCWWPLWARREALQDVTAVSIVGRTTHISKWAPTNREFYVESGEAGVARVATFYYPYWKATVNDTRVEVGKDENGVLMGPVSEGPSSVKISFEEPGYYKMTGWVALVTWVLMIAGVMRQLASRLQRSRDSIA